MTLSHDEIAGIVDLFGALSRPELDRALEEYGYRQDVAVADDAVAGAVDAYALVEYDPTDGGDAEPRLAVGPAAFPELPDGAEDLPHILDVDARAPDRGALERHVEERFRGDVARAVAAGDDEACRRLLDVSYDLEAWGDIELRTLRDRLDAALE
jgi:hypothetical protein